MIWSFQTEKEKVPRNAWKYKGALYVGCSREIPWDGEVER